MGGASAESPDVTNVSGGVNVQSDQVTVSGDMLGRDKIVQGDEIKGDKIVNYVQLDVQKLLDTLKQALPEDDPLPAHLVTALKDFQQYHTRLYEWKELHNVLNDVIFVFDARAGALVAAGRSKGQYSHRFRGQSEAHWRGVCQTGRRQFAGTGLGGRIVLDRGTVE